MRNIEFIVLSILLVTCLRTDADDWPEWRGQGRQGLWTETGITKKCAPTGLLFKWRLRINAGYSGPAVAQGKVFVTDYRPTDATSGIERALCVDEKSGRILWSDEWKLSYGNLAYAAGPRATPTVDGDRVYVLGASGELRCLRIEDGKLLWRKNYCEDFAARLPAWGFAAAPLVDGDRLLCLAGGKPDALVLALDKRTGKEIWRSLSDSEPGYSQLVVIEAGGTRQLVVWHAAGVSALDPSTGKRFWHEPFVTKYALVVASPVIAGNRLLFSTFFNGSMTLKLAQDRPAATVLWKGRSQSEKQTDGLHALISTPVIDGNFIYGICSYGQLRCLKADTGERVWESTAVTREQARWATAFLVKNGDRYFINNDRGELIIAKMDEKGFHEMSRTQLIKPTNRECGRRELGAVNWTHPAYATKHIFTRNDEQLICASLAQ